jgi:hypothetical protein
MKNIVVYPYVTVEPVREIPEVYQWEINVELPNKDNFVTRVRVPNVYEAVRYVLQELQNPPHGNIQAKLVDAYRDCNCPERVCDRPGCGTSYRGGGVYCSHSCAVNDRAACGGRCQPNSA